jgi:hypothetical protein
MAIHHNTQGWGPQYTEAQEEPSQQNIVILSNHRSTGNPPKNYNAKITFEYHRTKLMEELETGELTQEKFLQKLSVLMHIAKNYLHMPPHEMAEVYDSFYAASPSGIDPFA